MPLSIPGAGSERIALKTSLCYFRKACDPNCGEIESFPHTGQDGERVPLHPESYERTFVP